MVVWWPSALPIGEGAIGEVRRCQICRLGEATVGFFFTSWRHLNNNPKTIKAVIHECKLVWSTLSIQHTVLVPARIEDLEFALLHCFWRCMFSP